MKKEILWVKPDSNLCRIVNVYIIFAEITHIHAGFYVFCLQVTKFWLNKVTSYVLIKCETVFQWQFNLLT